MAKCRTSVGRIFLALAVLASLSVGGTAVAARRMVMPASGGWDTGGCYRWWGSGTGDSQVMRRNLCTYGGGPDVWWHMPLAVENRVGGGTVNAWINVTTGTNITAYATLVSYYPNGVQYSYSTTSGTTGQLQLSVVVPQDGTAEALASIPYVYATINSYAWDFNYP